MYKEFLESVGTGSPTGSVLEETIAVSVTIVNKRAKMTQPNASPNSFMQQSERNASRSRRSLRGKSPSGRMSRWPCKDYLKGTCTNSFCEWWHPPECLFYKTKSGCRFGEKCSYAHRQVDEQRSKRSHKNDDESAVAMLKKNELHDRMGQPVVDRDIRRESNHGPVGRRAAEVYLTEERKLLHVIQKFETKIPRSVTFVQVNLMSVAPTLQNLRIGLWRRQSGKSKGAREAAWRLAKSVLKLKEHQRATFFSSPENRCLPASTLKPEEREFVVDSGASMHMISTKGLE